MLSIHFYPDSDDEKFASAVREYVDIWQKDGERIVRAWEQRTGLKFAESSINSIVFNGISHSHPLSLRYDLSLEIKRTTLVHELGHRILFGRRKQKPIDSLENHKHLYLVLYDVLIDLYGMDSADVAIEHDKALREINKEACDWALQFDERERQVQLQNILR